MDKNRFFIKAEIRVCLFVGGNIRYGLLPSVSAYEGEKCKGTQKV